MSVTPVIETASGAVVPIAHPHTPPRIILVHGFNVRDPEKSVGRLRQMLEFAGFRVDLFQYGWTELFGARFETDNFADTLLSALNMLQDDEIIIPIGHSNGCNLVNQAAMRMERYKRLLFTHAVYLNPALDRDTPMAPNMRKVDVFFNKGDAATTWARWLPANPWGDMGARGYVGSDSRYVNHNCWPTVSGHSALFTDAGLEYLLHALVYPLADQYAAYLPQLAIRSLR